MNKQSLRSLAFSIDFEGYVEGMEESFLVPSNFSRFDIQYELEFNSGKCLELLSKFDVKATFFIVGWIAEKFPQIVKEISSAGHEIGNHSYFHKRFFDLDKTTSKNYILRCKQILEDVTGKRVIGFRAPDFSLSATSWILDYLAEIEFLYDSSLVATGIHDVYGTELSSVEVHRLSNGLIEFPIATKRFFNWTNIPIGGGGYFRLIPFRLTRRWLNTSADPISYLHPYEIGGEYPRNIKMSIYRRFRHNYNNGRIEKKIEQLFTSFHVMPIKKYLELNHSVN